MERPSFLCSREAVYSRKSGCRYMPAKANLPRKGKIFPYFPLVAKRPCLVERAEVVMFSRRPIHRKKVHSPLSRIVVGRPYMTEGARADTCPRRPICHKEAKSSLLSTEVERLYIIDRTSVDTCP